MIHEPEWIEDEEFEEAIEELVGLQLSEVVHEVDYDVLIFMFTSQTSQPKFEKLSLTPWGTWHLLYNAKSTCGYIGGNDHDGQLSPHIAKVVKRKVKSIHFWREQSHIYIEFDNGYWLGMFDSEKYLGYEMLVKPIGKNETTTYKVRDGELTRNILNF